MAILLSSHLLNQVQSVCDRIGIFASGRLIGQGTMSQLAQRFGDGRHHVEIGLDLADGDDGSPARRILGAVPGVSSVVDGAHAGDPWVVTMAAGVDPIAVRTAILAVVASEGLPLASIRAVVPSLEDIYRRAVARPAVSSGPTRPGRDGEATNVADVPAARHEARDRSVDPVAPVTLPTVNVEGEDQP